MREEVTIVWLLCVRVIMYIKTYALLACCAADVLNRTKNVRHCEPYLHAPSLTEKKNE